MPIVLSGALSAIAYTLLLIRWRGHTNFWESLYVIPGGFGTGIASSAVFIALAASVTDEELAIAGTGLYTFSGIGGVIGITASGAIFQSWTKKGLELSLQGVENRLEVSSTFPIEWSEVKSRINFSDCSTSLVGHWLRQ